jgi:hypothetical protein
LLNIPDIEEEISDLIRCDGPAVIFVKEHGQDQLKIVNLDLVFLIQL